MKGVELQVHSWSCAVALALCICACADLSPLEPESCGNAVVEAGEDCDTFAIHDGEGLVCGMTGPPERTCRYLCGSDPTSPRCPTGWACVRQGICARPSGRFEEAPGSPFPLPGDDWLVADLNGDGISDILAHDRASLVVDLGGTQGRFTRRWTFATPDMERAPVVGDLNGDGSADIVLPLPEGLVTLLGGTEELLLPTSHTAIAPQELYPLDVYTGGAEAMLVGLAWGEAYTPWRHVLVLYADGETFYLQFLGTPDLPTPIAEIPVQYGLSDLASWPEPINIDTDPMNMAEEIALAFTGHDRVYVFGASTGAFPFAMDQRAVVELGESLIEGGALFADANGDGRLDLLIGVDGGRVMVADGDGLGGFGEPRVDDRFDDLLRVDGGIGIFDFEVVLQRWPLAAGDFNGDGAADYVSPNGVYLAGGEDSLDQAAWRLTPDPWWRAVVDDVNGDGALDVLAVADPARGSEKVDLLLGTGTGLFASVSVALDGIPTVVKTGDFDGDLIADAAVALRDRRGIRFDAVAVLYGNASGGMSDPMTMGRFRVVDQLAIGPTYMPQEPMIDMLDDVLVIANDDPSTPERSVGLLFGHESRQMLSPFFLMGAEDGLHGAPHTTVIGHFAEGADGLGDIAAIARNDDDESDVAWLIESFADGHLDTSWGKDIGDIFPEDECGTVSLVWTAVDLGDDGFDELFGVDGGYLCDDAGAERLPVPRIVIASFDETGFVVERDEALDADLRVPYQTDVADIDGDGVEDVLASFSGAYLAAESGATSGSDAVIFWGSATDLGMSEMATVPMPEDATQVVASAAIDADEDLALEIALLTDQGVSICQVSGRAVAGPCTSVFGILAVERTALGGERLYAADANGDGLQDLLVGDGTRISVFLALPHTDEIDGSKERSQDGPEAAQ